MLPRPRRIAIVDDHPMFIAGLKTTIESISNTKVVGTFFNGTDYLISQPKIKAEYVILDIRMPRDIDGFETAKKALEVDPTIKIIMMTMFDEPEILKKVFELPVCGFITKDLSPKAVKAAITKILEGECFVPEKVAASFLVKNMKDKQPVSNENNSFPKEKNLAVHDLSIRQIEIIRLIGNGNPTNKISDKLHIAPSTVEWHKNKIMRKIGVTKSIEIVEFAQRMKLV